MDTTGERESGPAQRGPDMANVLPFRKRSESEPPLRTVLGGVLRHERHRQQRTLADVADAAAVSLPYLSEIERGRKEVSSEVLAAVCRALDLPLVDLVQRSALRLGARPQGGSGIQMRAA